MRIDRRIRRSVLASAALALLLLATVTGPALADPLYPHVFPPMFFPIVNADLADPCEVDKLVQYAVEVANLVPPDLVMVPPGCWDATLWTVVDILPAGLDYVSSEPAGMYDAGQHTLRWELGGVAKGSHRSMQVTLRPDPTAFGATHEVSNNVQLWLWVAGPMFEPPAEPGSEDVIASAARILVNECSQATTIVADGTGWVAHTSTLRQGQDSYWGVADTYLDRGNASRPFGSSPWLYLKTTDNATILIRFDLSTLPAGSEITSAKLRLFLGTTSPANVPMSMQLYALSRQWADDQATWQQAQDGAAWQSAGANGPGDRAAMPDAELACYQPTTSAARVVEFDVTELAEQWVADAEEPAENFGVIVKPSICRGTALYYVYSSESRTTERRPELYLEYETPPTP